MKKGFIALELVLLITILAGIAAAVKLAGEVQNLQKYAMMDAGGGGGSNLIGGGSGNTSSGGSIGGGVKDPWPGSNSPAPTSKPQQSGDCFCDSAGYWTGPGCGSKLRKSCSATPRPTSQAPTPIWNCSSQGCVTIAPPFGIGSAGGVIPCKIGQQVYEKCVAKKIFVKTQEECDEAQSTMSNCANPVELTGAPSNSDTGSPSWIAGIIGSGLEIINSLIPSWNFIGGTACQQNVPGTDICLSYDERCKCNNGKLSSFPGKSCPNAGDPCGILPTNGPPQDSYPNSQGSNSGCTTNGINSFMCGFTGFGYFCNNISSCPSPIVIPSPIPTKSPNGFPCLKGLDSECVSGYCNPTNGFCWPKPITPFPTINPPTPAICGNKSSCAPGYHRVEDNGPSCGCDGNKCCTINRFLCICDNYPNNCPCDSEYSINKTEPFCTDNPNFCSNSAVPTLAPLCNNDHKCRIDWNDPNITTDRILTYDCCNGQSYQLYYRNYCFNPKDDTQTCMFDRSDNLITIDSGYNPEKCPSASGNNPYPNCN